jgi:hypothetical protein
MSVLVHTRDIQRAAQIRTTLIGQCRNRYYFDYKVGMRKRRNSD